LDKRNILITVTGLTPQVITETCYYLFIKKRPKIKITEVMPITTAYGKKLIIKTLLNPTNGKFYQFCHDYSINPNSINFNKESIIVLKGKDRKDLSDIRTKIDNEYISSQINDLIKNITKDINTSLFCSIAGGRKTMGVYLASALQLYGRKQDILSHVLVSPNEFENHKDFFYKPKKDLWLNASDGKRINTRNAKIELAEIPLIRLRERFTDQGTEKKTSFSETISNFQNKIDTSIALTSLSLNHASLSVCAGNSIVKLSPIQYVIYRYFINLKKENCKHPKRSNCEGCLDCYPEIYELEDDEFRIKLTEYYSEIFKKEESGLLENMKKVWLKRNNIISTNLRTNISRINKVLKTGLSDAEYYFCKIDNVAERRPAKYGIRIDKGNIAEMFQ
jgi:CRISPR-associated protein (TIGR02584 family)|tara:strand:+ start:388 stop:1563 length:1176 start_codon:yes stop_codon:yes gene_type:complete